MRQGDHEGIQPVRLAEAENLLRPHPQRHGVDGDIGLGHRDPVVGAAVVVLEAGDPVVGGDELERHGGERHHAAGFELGALGAIPEREQNGGSGGAEIGVAREHRLVDGDAALVAPRRDLDLAEAGVLGVLFDQPVREGDPDRQIGGPVLLGEANLARLGRRRERPPKRRGRGLFYR